MKKILILGGGTGGTIMANKLEKPWKEMNGKLHLLIRIRPHYYQPGFLFIPFGIYNKYDVIKPKSDFFPAGINVIYTPIESIDGDNNKVILEGGKVLNYDFLIIATGTQTRPDETPGLKEELWYKNIFDFYTIEGAVALREFFKSWEGGRLVVNIAELPFKCPVAPLEFVFLADAYFHEIGIRDKVEITYVTPLPGAFTKPQATKMLGELLNQKNIKVIPEFYIEKVDNENKKIISYDEQEIPFDVLTIVPVNMGSDIIGKVGLVMILILCQLTNIQ